MAPAELEALLLTHPFVQDCAVISVPHHTAGEAPKAYVVKSESCAKKADGEIISSISSYVEKNKARYKWLRGGVEFLDIIPKSPSGKILRQLLRSKERTTRTMRNTKL